MIPRWQRAFGVAVIAMMMYYFASATAVTAILYLRLLVEQDVAAVAAVPPGVFVWVVTVLAARTIKRLLATPDI